MYYFYLSLVKGFKLFKIEVEYAIAILLIDLKYLKNVSIIDMHILYYDICIKMNRFLSKIL